MSQKVMSKDQLSFTPNPTASYDSLILFCEKTDLEKSHGLLKIT